MKIPQAIPKGNASQNEIAEKPLLKSIGELPLHFPLLFAIPEFVIQPPPLIPYQDISGFKAR
jgi:hypothetical protein